MTHSRPLAQASDHQTLLVRILRGEAPRWPQDWLGATADAFVDAALYHGIAALLVENEAGLDGWPDPVMEALRGQARAQAMWELRHRQILSELLAALARNGIKPILMKGTAVAYDLYANPACRSRGDSDLLVAPGDLNGARSVLEDLGYRVHPLTRSLPDDLASQEIWNPRRDDGSEHAIDLHWQVLNAAALNAVLTFAECASHARPLPRLSPEAHAMDRVRTLIHTCVHRALHLTAPYFVGGKEYYGSDRLIWTNDIRLLASSLTPAEWQSFCSLAAGKGVAAACRNGVQAARSLLGTVIPDDVLASLQTGSRPSVASAYLAQRRALPRAWMDLRAVPGLGAKLRYLRGRLLPGGGFLRARYPRMTRMPLPLLHVRRLAGLVRRRGG